MTSIKINNLTVERGKRDVVENVNLNITEGKITGLLGPSGCGKTTLMRSIVGVQIIKSGEIFILGEESGSKEVRGEVGYMSQDPALYEDISVNHNIGYFAKVLGVKKNRINEVLDLTELNDYKKSLVGNLSGGERARLSLGISILSKPKILILDEPTVGVDPLLRRKLWNVFSKLSEEGLCYDCKEHSEAIKGFTCDTCDEFFEEPEKDYEFDEAAKEAKLEDEADERRDMGL